LAGEICVCLGRYPGVFIPRWWRATAGDTDVRGRPRRVRRKSAFVRGVHRLGVGLLDPGTCRDLGPQTFECILPGA
jgi:hypothetical protein